jgi:hypothetical protein
VDRRGPTGTLVVSAGLAVAVSAAGYALRGSGIDHTAGALLVVVSTTLLFGASLVLALTPAAPSLRWALLAAAVLGALATAVAAALLHAWAVMVLMAIALLAGTASALPPLRRRRGLVLRPAGMVLPGGVLLAAAIASGLGGVSVTAEDKGSAKSDGQAWLSAYDAPMGQKSSPDAQILRPAASPRLALVSCPTSRATRGPSSRYSAGRRLTSSCACGRNSRPCSATSTAARLSRPQTR